MESENEEPRGKQEIDDLLSDLNRIWRRHNKTITPIEFIGALAVISHAILNACDGDEK